MYSHGDGSQTGRNQYSRLVFGTAATVQEPNMDKDRIKGTAHQAKGAVKEAAGKVTGDAKTEAEGKAEKAAGKVQNAAGGLKDSLRDK
jgi:uncharacterized protein YjbJ (UPF0337 family)